MYSGGTLASSGATAIMASRDTSVNAGRDSVRGSWMPEGEVEPIDIDIDGWWGPWPWLWPCMAKADEWEATWNMSVGAGGEK